MITGILLLSICTRISAKPIDDVDEGLLFCFVVPYNSVTMSNQQLLSKLIASLITSSSSSSSSPCFLFSFDDNMYLVGCGGCVLEVFMLGDCSHCEEWSCDLQWGISWQVERGVCAVDSQSWEMGRWVILWWHKISCHPTPLLLIHPRWPWTLDDWSQSLDTNAVSISADDLLIQSSLGASTLVTESSNINSTRGFPQLALPPTLKANLGDVHYYPSYDHS